MPPRAGTAYPDTWRIPDLSEPRYSQSLERGLAILECFTPETPVLGIADIAERLGMSRSTTHRYVTTLLALGYLEQGAKRKYRLGLRVTDLGMAALNETSLREHAHADLAELRTGRATRRASRCSRTTRSSTSTTCRAFAAASAFPAPRWSPD